MRKFSFLLRNVSVSTSFSFRYDSSSLHFGLMPWQFQNRMFKSMKVIKGYLSWNMMHYSGQLGGFRLFGTALGELQGGEVDYKVVSGFKMDLEVEFTLVLVNVKGLKGAGALKGPIDSSISFAVTSNLRIFLAA